jgi:hypothetical protein
MAMGLSSSFDDRSMPALDAVAVSRDRLNCVVCVLVEIGRGSRDAALDWARALS